MSIPPSSSGNQQVEDFKTKLTTYFTIIQSYQNYSREKIYWVENFIEKYNIFLKRNEKVGFKFSWEEGNVYFVEMASTEHKAILSMLADIFRVPNNGVRREPIKVLGQSCKGSFQKRAQDIAVCPSTRIIAKPNIPHPGPLPRLFPCKNYCGSSQHSGNHENRSMLARLWMRENPVPAGFVALTDPNLPGVSVKEWDFGTLQYVGNTSTACIRAGLPNYQVTIPVSAVFGIL
ncbi:hypothetical protein C1646_755265 [Rhizophagus diaphanus]|nr:hypothetical protein C1646_755265 [Rhizophagus diaphanus] [Rhizophagus sp. MUCL 43196]